MQTNKRYFEVVVRGQYHSISEHSTTPVLKNYEAKFILPSQEAALSVICKHLLAPYLRKKYPDFVRFRTYKLVSIVANGRAPNTNVLQMSIDEMNIEQLSDFCILKQILIDPYKHSDLNLIKEKIAEEWRVKRQTFKDEANTVEDKSRKEADMLLELNNLPKEDGPVTVSINEQKLTDKAQVIKPNVVPPPSRIPSEELRQENLPAEEASESLGDFFDPAPESPTVK